MQRITAMRARALVVLFCVGVIHGAAAEPAPTKLPPFAPTLGLLSSFIYSAQVLKDECVKHVGAQQVEKTVGGWFARNKLLIEKINEAGRTTKWMSDDRTPAEAWARLQRSEAAAQRTRILDALEPHPKSFCIDLLRGYDDGTYELANFPAHLKSLGIALPESGPGGPGTSEK